MRHEQVISVEDDVNRTVAVGPIDAHLPRAKSFQHLGMRMPEEVVAAAGDHRESRGD